MPSGNRFAGLRSVFDARGMTTKRTRKSRPNVLHNFFRTNHLAAGVALLMGYCSMHSLGVRGLTARDSFDWEKKRPPQEKILASAGFDSSNYGQAVYVSAASDRAVMTL